RLELPQLAHPARRLEVVEDGLVSREALEPHDLLGQQQAVVPELDVPLARNGAAGLVERHDDRILRPRPPAVSELAASGVSFFAREPAPLPRPVARSTPCRAP